MAEKDFREDFAISTVPTHHWKLNGDLLDSVGSNHGVATDVVYSSGALNEGISFNGSSTSVDLTSTFTLSKDASTFCFWLKPTAADVGSGAYLFTLATGVSNSFSSHILMNYTAALFMETNTNCNGADFNGWTWQADTWTHVAMVFDTSLAYIYINGLLVGEADNYQNINCSSGVASALLNDLSLKTFGGGGTYVGRFRGEMDDVRAYTTTALTSQEIYALYNPGIHSAQHIKIVPTSTIIADSTVRKLGLQSTIDSFSVLELKKRNPKPRVFGPTTAKPGVVCRRRNL